MIEVWRTQYFKEEEEKEAASGAVEKNGTKGEDTRSIKSYACSVSITSTKELMEMNIKRRGSAVAISKGVRDMVSGSVVLIHPPPICPLTCRKKMRSWPC